GPADDASETKAQLLRHERLEAVAVAVGGVLAVAVAPGERPVVAALGPADDLLLRRPGDPFNDRTRRRRVAHRRDYQLEEALHATTPFVGGVLGKLRLFAAHAEPHGDDVQARADDEETVAEPERPKRVLGHVRKG